jgi:hypothetical protein
VAAEVALQARGTVVEAVCSCGHALGLHERLPILPSGLHDWLPYRGCLDPSCGCKRWAFEVFRQVVPPVGQPTSSAAVWRASPAGAWQEAG